MSKLLGEGVLLVLLDIDESPQREVDRWYVEEHFPERIAELGYLRARRYRALEGAPAYMGLMEASTPAALFNDGYRRVTANPSERTKAMRGAFKRGIRSTHRVIASQSRASGGVMLCVRITFDGDTTRSSFAHWTRTQTERLVLAHPQILALHALACAPEVREEMDNLRPTGRQDEASDCVLLIELGRESDFDQGLRAALAASGLRAAGMAPSDVSHAVYQLMFGLPSAAC